MNPRRLRRQRLAPSESGDITIAPLRLLKKNKLHGTVLCLIALNDPSDRVYF